MMEKTYKLRIRFAPGEREALIHLETQGSCDGCPESGVCRGRAKTSPQAHAPCESGRRKVIAAFVPAAGGKAGA